MKRCPECNGTMEVTATSSLVMAAEPYYLRCSGCGYSEDQHYVTEERAERVAHHGLTGE